MIASTTPVPKHAPPAFNYWLAALVSTAIIATGGFTLAVYDTVTTVQIHGPLYTQIVLSKDLVVDAFPPPLYIVESYLLTFELLDAPPSARKALVRRFQQLEREFLSKRIEWHDRLPPGPLRDNLTGASGRFALEGDRERCLEAEMDDYLGKPFSQVQLRQTLLRWMHPTQHDRLGERKEAAHRGETQDSRVEPARDRVPPSTPPTAEAA